MAMEEEKVGWARRCVDGGEGGWDIWRRIKQHWCFGWDGVEGSRREELLVLKMVE
jgi:hypothetical protein